MADFIFVTCQVGAEGAVKGEVARRWPRFRFAYSQPGFLTFKLPDGHGLADDFDLESVFARSYGFSLKQVSGSSPEELVAAVWESGKGRTFQRIHVWEKDRLAAGDHGYEPAISPTAIEAHRLLVGGKGDSPIFAAQKVGTVPLVAAKAGELVLDCVILSPDCWWVGYHRARRFSSCYPGGMLPLEMPADAVSRAWLKMEEALQWSQLPIPRGARVVELGSAPGGASQALLGRGFFVTGVDPGEMAPAVLNHPRFTHLRGRSTQLRRREFRKMRWLTADMNVAPNYTLDAVEAIISHPEVSIRGMLLTLKMSNWGLASHVPDYVARVRSWGFNVVQARQLQHNRREICVMALQKPFRRKPLKER